VPVIELFFAGEKRRQVGIQELFLTKERKKNLMRKVSFEEPAWQMMPMGW
jgi:hypothetical protein